MFMTQMAGGVRAMAVAMALVVALGAAACGGEDGGDGGGAAAAKTRSGGDPDGTPEEQVKAAYDAFVADFYAHRSGPLCTRLTDDAQQRFGGDRPCKRRFDTMFEEETFVADRPYVVQAEVEGDQASVRVKTRKSNAYSVPLRKEDGEWKIDGGFATG